MEQSKAKNPGINVFAVLIIIWAILIWLTGLSSGGSGKLVSVGNWKLGYRAFLVSDNFFVNFCFYVQCSLPILAGVGVLMRKNWARWLYIILAMVQLIYVLVYIGFDFDLGSLKFILFEMAFYMTVWVLSVWYFTRPKVKEQFK